MSVPAVRSPVTLPPVLKFTLVPESVPKLVQLCVPFVPASAVVASSVIWGSSVILPRVTLTVSLASTRLSSIVGTVIVAVVAPAGIVTLARMFE